MLPGREADNWIPGEGKLEKRIIGFPGGEAGEEDNWIPGRGRRIKWIPGGDGAGVHFHCPPCLSDVCSFMTDCIRPDRTSVADMWTIENVLRLRLHAGEGNKNMPGYVLHAEK